MDRLQYFEERSHQHKENLAAQMGQEQSDKIEQCLASEYKLQMNTNEDEEMYEALQGEEPDFTWFFSQALLLISF